MKKHWSLGVMILCMVLACIHTVNAEESQSTDVYAKHIGAYKEYTSTMQNNTGTVTLSDGAKVSVSVEVDEDEDITLVVIPIKSETREAWNWIVNAMPNSVDKIIAFDIFFKNKDGEKYIVNKEMEITFTLPDAYEKPAVYYLNYNGETEKQSTRVVGSKIIFRTNHNSYYVLVNENTTALSAVVTGDQTNGTVIGMITVMSIIGIGFAMHYKRKLGSRKGKGYRKEK